MNTYDVGDVARITASFTNSAGTAVDPTSLAMYHGIVRPLVTLVTSLVYGPHSITRISAGEYYTDVAVNSHGEWHYRWIGAGANAAAVSGKFIALLPVVGP